MINRRRSWFSGLAYVAILWLGASAYPALFATARSLAADAEPRDAKASMLVEPAELQERLGEADLRILDTRAAQAYGESHVPGAVHVDVADWKALALREGGLHDADAWSEKVETLGIRRTTPVVVYGEALPDATRIWWTLKYLGVEDVALLNGGWKVWTAENLPTDSETPTIEPVKFEPEFQDDRLEEIASLKKRHASSEVAVVDCRSEAEYTGKQKLGLRAGRIPGAIHLEWSDVLTEDGRFKPVDELEAMFIAQGVLPEKVAVTHCQSGGRATVNAFALELLGYPQVRLYYASWQEWSADEKAPVEK